MLCFDLLGFWCEHVSCGTVSVYYANSIVVLSVPALVARVSVSVASGGKGTSFANHTAF